MIRHVIPLLALAASAPAIAVGTTAGTLIQNQAQVEYTPDYGPAIVELSNIVTLRVDEILDVSVARNDATDLSVSPASIAQPLSFRITNNGNGNENFRLTGLFNLAGDQFDPTSIVIAIDTNGNGQYDASVDQIYVPGQNDPLLAPDQSIIAFILGNIPTALNNGDRSFVTLSATATTGSGAPGTTFTGLGDTGSDAVVGHTTAKAQDQSIYVAALVNTQFTKSQAVSDPQGGNTTVPGSIITYTLITRVTGSGQISAAAISDAVPAQTTYISGSLRLNGTAITDAVDADAGHLTNGTVQVALGTVSAPATHTVTFQVKLN